MALVSLRQLLPEDAARFREFRLAALRDSPGSFGASAAEEESYPPAKWHERVAQPGSAVIGAFDAGRLVGTLGYFVSGEDQRAWLWTMYVAPSHRGTGIGRRLLGEAAQRLRAAGHKQVFLTVTAPAAAARRLYASCGFRTTAVRPGQFRHSGLVLDVEEMALTL